MSLASQINALASRVGAEIKSLRSPIPFGSQRNSAFQSIPSGSITKITSMGTGEPLAGGMTWVSNGFVIPRAGVYDTSARVSWASNATGLRIFYLRKNGSTVATWSSAAMAGAFTMSGSMHIPCLVGDVVDLHCYQNSGADLNIVHNAGDVGLTIAYQGA